MKERAEVAEVERRAALYMKREKELKSAIAAVDFAGHGEMIVYNRAIIHIEKHESWNYDDLAIIVQMIGTSKLRFVWESGFAGSEVTPGDPDSVWIEVTYE
jgi:hypothetical protein